MIDATLEHEFDSAGVLASTTAYQREVELAAGIYGAEVMASGMRDVPPGSPPSAPGGFPNAIGGELKASVSYASDGDSVIVGPTVRSPPNGYTLIGAESIPELLNEGGAVEIRQQRRSKRTGRYLKSRRRRISIRPRPFVRLTLRAVAQALPGIAASTPLKRG